ncbi:kinase-like protein [Trametes cingulata]|nr:kinase-like protein [Trametes cingulata]
MSILQTVFACLNLFPGSPTPSSGSTTRLSPAFGLRGHDANHFALPRAPLPGSVVSSRTSSRASHTALLDDLEKRHGLGTLVATSIGLPRRPGLNSLPPKLVYRNASHGAHGALNARTPSPLSLFDFPETPENGEHIQPYPAAFARATPPKIYWSPAPASPAPLHETYSPAPSPPPPPSFRDLSTIPDIDYANAATMYVSALQESYSMPPPRLNTIIIPSLDDLIAGGFSKTYADAGAGSSLLSPTDTEPAYSPKASKVFGNSPISPMRVEEVSYPGASAVPEAESAENADDPRGLQTGGASDTHTEGGQDEDSADDHGCDDDHGNGHDELKHPDGTTYRLLGKLGEGAYGNVMAAVTSACELVALKIIHKPTFYKQGHTEDILYNERDIMVMAARAGAPFLLHIKAAWEDKHNVYIAMECCVEDLRSRMNVARMTGKAISPSEVQRLCAEMLMALEDLEDMRIVHGDIKPENFLVRPTGQVVLCDFGLAQNARALEPDHNLRLPFWEWHAPYTTGTAGYYPPEVLRRVAQENVPYTSKADIFSLGLVFVELFCGLSAPLWDTPNCPEGLDIDPEAWRLMDNVRKQAARMMTEGLGDILTKDRIPDKDARNMLYQMLQPDPRERPTVNELLRHPYFWNLNLEALRSGYILHDYKPRFFDHLNPGVTNVGLHMWANRRGKKSAWEQIAETKGPLEKFTWPEPKAEPR